MSHRHGQCGFIMLPVVIALTLLATVAYLLNRDAGMGASLAGRGLDGDSARYLAEAGLARMNYQAQSRNCTGYGALTNVSFGSGTFTASVTPTAGSPVSMTATGTTADGGTATLTRGGVIVRQTNMRTAALQPDATTGWDAWINQKNPRQDTNYGRSDKMRVATAGSDPGRALIKFDLSTIPAGSRISSATLTLYQRNVSISAGAAVNVHRLTTAWVEGTQDGGGTADGATWLWSNGTTPWTSPGGDYDTTASASAPVDLLLGFKTWDITLLVEGWVNGAYANNGMTLVGSGTIQEVAFSTSDETTASQRPKLDVSFYPPCGWTTAVTFLPTADTNIRGSNANTNYGSLSSMDIYESDQRRGLYRFDISAVPAGTVLATAKLRLYVESISSRSGATMNLEVHALAADWTESLVTWNTRAFLAPWTTPGGDYAAAIAAPLALPSSFNSGWIEFPITALAQAWLDGVTPNRGVIVLENSLDRFKVTSSDAAGSNGPQLVLTY